MSAVTWIGLADLAGLPCPYCGRELAPDTPWAVTAQQLWGRIGVAFKVEGRVAGLLLVAPADDPREAVLQCLWVAPAHTRAGVGRRLVQAAAAGLMSRDVHAILARGSRVRRHCATPPSDFLRAVGFTRALDERLWRLDLDATVVERPRLRAVIERLVEFIRPVGPAPAGRASREG